MPFARLIEIAELALCARARFAFFVVVGAISLGCANARQAGGRALWFYPTIGAAIAGGLALADVLLPRVRAIRLGRSAHA